jgi:methylphosphotriester-DNA--protein-cysteine methyltransferase
MVTHKSVSNGKLHSLIRKGEIRYAGNISLKIYGTLKCSSGKRMRKENRVFFKSDLEARSAGFRPCAKCLHPDYKAFTKLL